MKSGSAVLVGPKDENDATTLYKGLLGTNPTITENQNT
jgi:hypothetical protein